MNRQTAIGLVVGTILALIIAFLTKDNKYYYFEHNKMEITKYIYEEIIDGAIGRDEMYLIKDFDFNTTLIVLTFLGGTGLGYLFSEQIEDKVVGIYRAKVKR